MRTHLAALLLVLTPACAALQDHHTLHGGHGHEENEEEEADCTPLVSPSRVLVLQAEHVDRPTEVLGVVDVHEPMESETASLDALRRRGACLGADAVLGVEFHHGGEGSEAIRAVPAGEARTHLSGVAVRYRNLLRPDPYDVLGELDVAELMGGEEEALAALRERARALHADLIIRIAYRHGDAPGQPTHLTGTAIRYRTPRASVQ
jgi:uncharacterized protein YbjQ (UPF0145 family)